MFIMHLKLARRNILKQKTISMIQILGLTFGLASVFAIILYLQHEFSYDRFHKKADRIYRVNEKKTVGNTTTERAITQQILRTSLESYFPDLEEVVQFVPGVYGDILVQYQDKKYFESGLCWATNNFFKVFSFDFIYGDAASALSDPSGIVLTERMAHKYFGDENPIGRMLDMDIYGG